MNKQFNPLISIVVITYNSSKYVIETLESVKAQTYQNIELIITDDCSTDDTVSICKNWMHKHKDRFVLTELVTTPKNMGIAPNCNVGLKACRGEWVKLIAGDDVLVNTLLEKYAEYITANKEVSVVCSNLREYNNDFQDENALPLTNTANHKINKTVITAAEQFQILLRSNQIWAPTVMFKKTIFEKVGYFDERYPFYEDRPMWLELTRLNFKIYYLDFIGVKYRKHEESVQIKSKNKVYQTRYEICKDKVFFEKYMCYFSFLERISFLILFYRNTLIRKLFKNRKSFFINVISATIGFIPNKILNWYKLKYL